MQLNAKQVIVIILAMIGFTATGIQQLEPVLGVTMVKAIASICTFVGGLMAAAMAPFLSNASLVKDASNVTGVEPIRINPQANQALAALAVDPSFSNIGPTEHEYEAVEAKASGATAS